MPVYPQLVTGTLAQFPAEKRLNARTVLVTAADGCTWKLADPAGCTTEWRLTYSDLSDEEAGALQQFFEAVEGSLRSFTFVDPLGNLYSWSGKLDHAAWSKGPLLSLTGSVPDPEGRDTAWRISNPGAAPQSLKQDLAAPSGYVYCVSAYVRSFDEATVTMILGPHRENRQTGAAWRRITMANIVDVPTEPVAFGLEFPAGAEVEVFGMQVEPQSAASGYKATTTGGVYENARLRDDALEWTATGLNRNSCTVNIIHVKHL